MNERTCQIAIIGGGPAGLSAALAAAEAGAHDIVLIEQKEMWGLPVQCAEYVPKLIGRLIDIPDAAVSSTINEMHFFLEGKPFALLRAPGFILNREVLEEDLAAKAHAAGVTLEQPARVLELNDEKIVIQSGTEQFVLKPRIVIGADGPKSLVRQHIGEPFPPFAVAVQDRLSKGPKITEAEIYISVRYGAGYAWAFPKRGEVNVGIAFEPGGAPLLRMELGNVLSELLRWEKVMTSRSSKTIGGLIPVGPPAAKTVKKNMLIVGDAAGQTNPLNGSGIYPAVVCGQMAGEIAAKAMKKNDLSLLEKYETSWRELFEKPLARAFASREKIRTCDPEDYISFFREAWGLKEKRREKKIM